MPTLRGKTNLACDTCRQRKSRCDGIRPICSHCRLHGRDCTYRPTPTNLETDASVLSRLANVEARLRAVEETGGSLGGHSDPGTEATLVGPPDLHTAAAYKMLHCWPRIRLNLTIPNLISQTYLAECDQVDPVLLEWATGGGSNLPQLRMWQVVQCIEEFYDNLELLPVYLALLFEIYPGLEASNVLGSLTAQTSSEGIPPQLGVIDIHQLSISQLLLLSMAMKTSRESLNLDSAEMKKISAASCAMALQRQWMLRSEPDEDLVSLLLTMAYYLVYGWARPFHALGILQSIDLAIKHMFLRRSGDQRVQCYARLHFILEGDILTEMDGFPSTTSLSILSQTRSNSIQLETVRDSLSPPANLIDNSSLMSCIENHVLLRSYLNRILHLLYITNKAYAQPHELADLVRSISGELRRWYRSLPLDQQFVRDATVFSMGMLPIDLRLREIAIRYFSCVFLLHRPVLYFFLHKDMEYSVNPPDVRNLNSELEPWVLESCRDCIESAALLIRFYCVSSGATATGERSYENWCSMQMLFAAYLTLLQVKPVTSLIPVFRNIGDLDELLGSVEGAFETFPVKSVKMDKSLSILHNERENFEVSSPTATLPG